MVTTEEAVRAWACGLYPLEAGVELLIRQGLAIRRDAPWIEWGEGCAAVDPAVLLEHSGAWSGGERRVVAIAASLLGGPPVDLSNAMSGLGRPDAALVLAALAHANGSHEHAHVTIDEERAVALVDGREPSLFAWPEEHPA